MLRSHIKVATRRVPFGQAQRNGLTAAATLRRYTTPSTPRSEPAVAEAATSPMSAINDGIMYTMTPKRDDEPHTFNPLPNLSSPPSPIKLPPPLPIDVTAMPGSPHSQLYQTTTTLDMLSILNLSAKRVDYAPRAFEIFRQLLADALEGKASFPQADAWAAVITGVLSLTAQPNMQETYIRTWRSRAAQIVQEWEKHKVSQGTAVKGEPAVEDRGILIYRAWFDGLISAGLSLEEIMPSIQSIGIEPFVRELEEPELGQVLDTVQANAIRFHNQEVQHRVQDLRGIITREAAIREAEPVPEVKPLLDNTSGTRRGAEAAELNEANSPGSPQTRFAIQNLRETLQHIDASRTAYQRQLDLESASYAAAEAALKRAAAQLEAAGLSELGSNRTLHRNGLQRHMYGWHASLTEYLEKELKEMRVRADAEKDGDEVPRWNSTVALRDSTMLLYLGVLPPKKLALITILELMRMVGSGGVTDGMKTLRGIMSVGRAIEAEHRAETIRTIAGKHSQAWQNTLDRRTNQPRRSAISTAWMQVGRSTAEGDVSASTSEPMGDNPTEDLKAVWTPPWTQMVQISVGSFLVEGLIKTARVDRYAPDPVTGEMVSEKQSAFSHSYEYIRGKKLGVVRLNPAVAKLLGTDELKQVIHPKHLPMLIPPNKWTAWNKGPYLTHSVDIMRFKDSKEQQNYIQTASEQGNLGGVFRGLDVLSSTPWRINRGVFDVVLEAWNSGQAIADIPAGVDQSKYVYPEKLDPSNNDPKARYEYIEQYKTVAYEQAKDHGERCKYNYNLEIARSYLNDVFYIPHNVDFRGRAYPIPPHLAPVGDDLCRGLLTFGIAKPLGATGLKWLQIHCANVSGFDKASFEERVQFAKDHEADIFDSADNPLTGRRWWLQAEDPWQCLSVCMELTAALRSEDPTRFLSSLPVHQDGTCNGMQHYAALGGDVRGAKAVNLEQGDRPADIYTGVAELVNASIAQDRADGVAVAQAINGPLGRKVVKQTVMTTVYGVTYIGARDQIHKQLVARGGFSPDEVYLVAGYIAKKVLASIGDLFAGARAIQDWLSLSARLISRSIDPERLQAAADTIEQERVAREKLAKPKKKKAAAPFRERLSKELMTAVVWTSPLGLPIAQPYRLETKKQVMTSLQTVFIHDPTAPARVSGPKQASAFPPNYIHSLDATHMLMTAVMCHNKDITFASVHDSYWTHASTVEDMSDAIRETFIHLHKQDLVGQLREELLDRFGDFLIPLSNAKIIKDAATRKSERLEALKGKGEERVTSAKEKFAAEEALEAAREDSSRVPDGEDALDVDAPPAEDEAGSEGLSLDEMAELTGGSDAVKTVTINGVAFVRFADLLPPPPPRGDFNVERIKGSQYFFS